MSADLAAPPPSPIMVCDSMKGLHTMATITLDDIRAEAERRYAPTIVELSDGSRCVLNNILNLDGKVSEKVDKTLKALSSTSGEDADITATRENAETLLRLVVVGKDNADRLIDELGSLARIIVFIERWTGEAQVGEASPSDG